MKNLYFVLVAGILLLAACSSTQETASTAGSADEMDGAETTSETVGLNERLIDVILQTPGVYLTPTGELRIRGSSQPPLFVVDGVPIVGRDLSFINSADVDTVRILKGPEAAIYGSRGGAGVIEITTKRGEQ